ncbi:GNAT family N-acetyltransferase [Plantactinospora sp. KBS50]|uniref:GNAT family N-acetyltransferase n=1 Tax=Plantactinospora sp. KBS50 TaxID=2024580 RepID=UPI000BAAF549|nr:GNAT family N-acetyltransferase [Plantactinospora sp. KBS50]ASW54213.1 GNAT family N-acetyltransferase [Plantactinospora sp. KBS50]
MIFREAVPADLPAVLGLLVDDAQGRNRDSTEVDEAYRRAFAEIAADPRNELIVGDDDGTVVACMQLTYIPGLSRHGAQRLLIEAVRVHSGRRGQRIGARMMTWAIDRARDRGCALVQLTTHKSRADAHRFYRRLGFEDSHEGMKLAL